MQRRPIGRPPGSRPLVVVVALAGCTGTIANEASLPPGTSLGSPGAGSEGAGGAPRTPESLQPQPSAVCTAGGGPAPVRRLTRIEYNNTVRDLLGDGSGPANDFGVDGRAGQFETNVESPVTANLATDYFGAAEVLAAHAKLDAIVPCTPAGADQELACARQFIATFGKRAYRRPLAAVEAGRLESLYTVARAHGSTFVEAVRLLISTLLQSPHFLDHIEKGQTGAGPVPLTPYELASRLSYFLWQTMPDQTLMAAADAGRLATAADVEREARRMLADGKGKSAMSFFYRQWLELDRLTNLDKSKTAFPQWSRAIGVAMRTETETYVSDVVNGSDPRLETLLRAPYSFVNGSLAKMYGVTGPTGDTTFKRVDLDPVQRAGILTQGSFLAAHAYSDQGDPVHRGKFVREALLCTYTPPPDPMVLAMVKVPTVAPGSTTRQRWEALFQGNDACAACHQLMNPIGFSMEHFDAIGQYRTTENGRPIDARGELTATDVDGPYDGVPELEARLARSGQARDCMARQWFTFALGRGDALEDRCALDRLFGDFAASGGNLRELLIAVARNDGFRFRAPVNAEVCR